MTEMAELRVLVAGDEARLFEFLEPHLDTSLFFVANVERAGLVDHGQALQATYVASFDAKGAITAVAGHAWNGNVMVQGDVGLEEVVVRAISTSRRAVHGFIGPWSLACRARHAAGMQQTPAAHDNRELLFGLELTELKPPSLLSRPDVTLRAATAAEIVEPLGSWRADYNVESLGAARTPQLEKAAREQVQWWCDSGTLWVLVVGQEVVAMTGFNAEARSIVQVGGVFTPPALRSRGYARAAVAASLQLAQSRGATRSVLFTPENNHAARRTYTSLGYQVLGDFGLILF